MKLYAHYQLLKRKAIQLLSGGYIDEYFETLMQISRIEKQLNQLRYLN